MKSKDLGIVFGTVVLILLVPYVVMQFTEEVNWGLMDFVVAGALLSCLGLAIFYISTRLRGKNLRWLYLFGIILLFILIWAELAVGIFGSPFAGS